MSAPEMPFDEEDVSTWTHKRVKLHVESSKKPLKSFYQNFFGWSTEEYKEAKDHTVAEMQKHFDLTKKFPTTGPLAKYRHTVQINLVRDRPDLFMNRHGPLPPAWFDAELISRSSSSLHTRAFDMKNVVQQFIAFSRSHESGRGRQRHILKRANCAEEIADSDEENDNDSQVPNKRPRTSWLGRTTPLSNTTSITMLASPSATISDSQRIVNTKQPSIGSTSNWNKNASARVIAGLDSRARAERPTSLILYVTRVTIMDQTLVLERDRFGLVDNLFENGQLIEPRIQELVFGNPMDNKPTFLWYFDDTSDDKPRMIRNRPSAEVALVTLIARAEGAEATGVQLFDALDRDTAALVPVHEVNRKDDFVQRVSFELEIDNEINDESNDNEINDESNDDEDVDEAEKASRVDSAYESRDGELQLDDVTIEGELQLDDVIVKEEFESKLNITWAGQQQQPENKIESDSESEEEEDTGRFHR
jgi:hypothetical protein